MKNSKQTIKIISFLWIGSLLGAGFSFLTQIILARELGPLGFGLFSTALATISLVTPLAGFGISQYWLKIFGQKGWDAKYYILPSFYFIGISTIVVITLIFLWALFGINDQLHSSLLFILSIYLIGQISIELVGSKLQLEERYISLVIWQFSPYFIRLLIVLIISFPLTDLISSKNIAYAYSAVSVIFILLGVRSLFAMFNGKFDLQGHEKNTLNKNLKKTNIKSVIMDSWPFGLAGFFYLIYSQSGIILVNYILNAEAAGIYNVANTIMLAVLIFPSIVYQKFLLPKMHRWANHDRKKFYDIYRLGNILMLILGIIMMLIIWIVAPFAISIIFGNAYLNAIDLLLVMAISIPIIFVASSVGATLVTKDHMKKKVIYMGLVALLNIICNIILIPIYGLLGAVASMVISNTILLIAYYLVAEKLVFALEKSKG